jgi:hypothetical protein
MPNLDVLVRDASSAQYQKQRADHLAIVLAAVIKHHGPLTFTSPELQNLIGTDPQLVTTYSPATDTYILRVR